VIPFDEINNRLEALGLDRKWLAQASGKKPDTIRGALAPGAPDFKRSASLQKALSDAIEKEEASHFTKPVLPDRITIECQPEERKAWAQAAAKAGMDLDAWVVEELHKSAEAWHEEQSKLAALPAPQSQPQPLEGKA
jgi:uncharacterized protein (DUF1778 family)